MSEKAFEKTTIVLPVHTQSNQSSKVATSAYDMSSVCLTPLTNSLKLATKNMRLQTANKALILKQPPCQVLHTFGREALFSEHLFD